MILHMQIAHACNSTNKTRDSGPGPGPLDVQLNEDQSQREQQQHPDPPDPLWIPDMVAVAALHTAD